MKLNSSPTPTRKERKEEWVQIFDQNAEFEKAMTKATKGKKEWEGYCHNCMVGSGIENVPESECRCDCHKVAEPTVHKYSRMSVKEDFRDIINGAIQNALSHQKQRLIEKAEELKTYDDWCVRGDFAAWNEAIDQVISLIQEE